MSDKKSGKSHEAKGSRHWLDISTEERLRQILENKGKDSPSVLGPDPKNKIDQINLFELLKRDPDKFFTEYFSQLHELTSSNDFSVDRGKTPEEFMGKSEPVRHESMHDCVNRLRGRLKEAESGLELIDNHPGEGKKGLSDFGPARLTDYSAKSIKYTLNPKKIEELPFSSIEKLYIWLRELGRSTIPAENMNPDMPLAEAIKRLVINGVLVRPDKIIIKKSSDTPKEALLKIRESALKHARPEVEVCFVDENNELIRGLGVGNSDE